MKYVIQVSSKDNKRTVSIIEVSDEPLELIFLKSNVGLSDGHSYIECVYKVFPAHPQIIFVVDEEGAIKNLKTTLFTGKHVLVGDVLICSVHTINEYGEQDLFGMNLDETFFTLAHLPPCICSILKTQQTIPLN